MMVVSFVEVFFTSRSNCNVVVKPYITTVKIKSISPSFEVKKSEINFPLLEKTNRRVIFEDAMNYDEPLNVVVENKNNEIRELLENSKYIFLKSTEELKLLRTLLGESHSKLELI